MERGGRLIINAIRYPSGMKIPGRARCNCFLDKYIHNTKTGKFNRKQLKNRSGTDDGLWEISLAGKRNKKCG